MRIAALPWEEEEMEVRAELMIQQRQLASVLVASQAAVGDPVAVPTLQHDQTRRAAPQVLPQASAQPQVQQQQQQQQSPQPGSPQQQQEEGEMHQQQAQVQHPKQQQAAASGAQSLVAAASTGGSRNTCLAALFSAMARLEEEEVGPEEAQAALDSALSTAVSCNSHPEASRLPFAR